MHRKGGWKEGRGGEEGDWAVFFKLDVQGQEGGQILDVVGWGVWKIIQFSWTPYVYRPLLDY